MECSVRKAFDRTLENRPKLSVPRRASLSFFCAFGSRVPDGSVLMTRAHLLTSFVVVVFFFVFVFVFLTLLSAFCRFCRLVQLQCVLKLFRLGFLVSLVHRNCIL